MSDTAPAELAERRKKRRRRFGLVLIVAALLLLVLGYSVLEPFLEGLNYILYWSVCFLCALLALFTALVDLAAVRRDALRERRRLVEETFTSRKRGEQTKEPEGHGGD